MRFLDQTKSRLLTGSQGVKEVGNLAERAKKLKIKEQTKPAIEAYIEYVD